jgi:acyl carrier protein
MTDAEVYDRLTEIMQDIFDDPDVVATPELSADDVKGWDSMTHIRLVLAVEKAFKIKFVASEVGDMKNVGEMVHLIKSKF